MKSNLILLSIFLSVAFSCSGPGQKKTTSDSDTTITQEYHSNGKIKTEISSVKGLREGPTRNYSFQGKLLSEVYYINNIKEGVATNFYAASGKINSTLVYKHGVKEGDETWFYESGKPYRISPYKNGVIEGVQKLYYQSGQIMAEVPYKNGFAGTGLKEYRKDGTLVTDYPKIVIRKEDHLQDANKIVLVISLSNSSESVKFYEGSLLEGKYLNKKMLLLATQQGNTKIDYNIAPGVRLNQGVMITANFRTPMGNPYIITKIYNLQAYNPL
jgi:antitoxin component YwqK of YwqJK toxin-antitoxin module